MQKKIFYISCFKVTAETDMENDKTEIVLKKRFTLVLKLLIPPLKMNNRI